jgi:hypothetical protein
MALSKGKWQQRRSVACKFINVWRMIQEFGTYSGLDDANLNDPVFVRTP